MAIQDLDKNLDVLIIEDDHHIRRATSIILKQMGYSIIHEGSDAIEAVEICSKVRPDVILMDISLGTGINGIETVKQLRANGTDSCIIYLTAFGSDTVIADAAATHPDGYLVKPVTGPDLHAAIQVAISNHRSNVILNQQKAMLIKEKESNDRLRGAIEMSGAICHEINQYLQYIMGYSEMVNNEIGSIKGDLMNPELDSIVDSNNRIISAIEQLGRATRKITRLNKYRTKEYLPGRVIIDIDSSTS
ncbi:MAG: hypothetical protein CVV64_17235 [Candidatus Wallbacteria bacterium HGW-Wallbacteria-1]|uniref:Response regulatory domain-containing protein n=1 Tax=Candidatus Wallbacteria bacterium HGW-Wallbacteria-1 TaxID=2013854 RepID=A0A2N1PKF1_9BACT|nr:MAG: hypothetical protein CVV64_17235 [Candidatus Wallbacteria bacterium HGW-Wallbacteria-1]